MTKKFILLASVAVLALGITSEAGAAKCELVGTKLVVSSTLTSSTVNNNDCPSNWRDTATEIEIQKGITTLNGGAFAGAANTKVTRVTIPDSVTEIQGSAFAGLSGITNLTIPSSVSKIDGMAFVSMGGLNSVNINTSNIPDGVFTSNYGTGNITSITLGDNVKTIGYGAFSGQKNVTSLTIPDSVTEIHSGAFWSMSGVTSLTIPSTVTQLDQSVFNGMSGLTDLNINTSTIPSGAFAYGCDSLTNVTIGDNVKTIEDGAFAGRSNVTSLTIPDSVTSIGNGAFQGMSGVTSLYVGAGVETIGNQAFQGMTGVTDLEINTATISDMYRIMSNVTSLTLGDNVTSIGQNAFSGMSKVTSLELGDNITSIGDGAFFNMSGVTSLTIPDSVTSIGDAAFMNMSGVTGALVIPDSVTTIGDTAFASMAGVTSLTIPDSVTSIGGDAFMNMSGLQELVIPDTLTAEQVAGWSHWAFENFPRQEVKIVCQGKVEKCQAALNNHVLSNGVCYASYCIPNATFLPATKDQCTGKYTWDESSSTKCRQMTASECNNSGKYFYSGGKCTNLPKTKTACGGADLLWVKGSCKISCPSGLVYYKEDCLSEYPFAKKHYTPAEAAQWLNEDNNTITLTFKKQ